MNRKQVIGIAAVVVVAVLAGAVGVYRTAQAKSAAQAAAQNQTYLARVHAPTEGAATARVHIVEFMDPACDTCREFSPLVKQLLRTHPGAIKLTVRHVAFHPNSEYAVRILEASRAQGKYWETMSAMLAAQPKWVFNHRVQPELIWDQIGGVGLDLDRIRADMNSPEVTQRIAQDASDAKALKVTMTPEFFVNGKPLPEFGYEQLNALVQSELAVTP